ncbi:MAG: hypothetical protein J6V03_06870 [Clostridia bacterium]|nr:hypothetical protein [Clostridia bacterium]
MLERITAERIFVATKREGAVSLAERSEEVLVGVFDSYQAYKKKRLAQASRFFNELPDGMN